MKYNKGFDNDLDCVFFKEWFNKIQVFFLLTLSYKW